MMTTGGIFRRLSMVVVSLVAMGLGTAALAASQEPGARSVTVHATPGSVPESGGEVELIAIVRDARGRPLEGARVNFLAWTGTLASKGSLVPTNADGAATDRLTLTATELAAVDDDGFQLAVAVGSSNGSLVDSNVRVGIQRRPRANFSVSRGDLLVTFDDISRGLVTNWSWDFGDGTTSTRQSPSHTFAQSGYYAVTLRVENSAGVDEMTALVGVFASQRPGE